MKHHTLNSRRLSSFAPTFMVGFALSLGGCGLIPMNSDTSFQNSGMLAISRRVPAAADLESARLLAFMPSPEQLNESWLKINRRTGSGSIMQGRKSVLEFQIKGTEDLKSGRYQVQHKQENPSWYAPDSYFLNRNLPLPPAYDRSRYLRGALGNKAIFLSDNTALHSGSIHSDEVGGARMSATTLDQIFSALPVGSVVEVG